MWFFFQSNRTAADEIHRTRNLHKLSSSENITFKSDANELDFLSNESMDTLPTKGETSQPKQFPESQKSSQEMENPSSRPSRKFSTPRFRPQDFEQRKSPLGENNGPQVMGKGRGRGRGRGRGKMPLAFNNVTNGASQETEFRYASGK